MKNITFLLTFLPFINSVPLFENHVLCSHSATIVGLMSFFFRLHLVGCFKSHCFVTSVCHWDTFSVVSHPNVIKLTAWILKCCILDAEVCSQLTDVNEAPLNLTDKDLSPKKLLAATWWILCFDHDQKRKHA